MNVSIEKINKNKNIIEILFNVKMKLQSAISLLKNIIDMSIDPEYTDNTLTLMVDNFIPEHTTMYNTTKLDILTKICDEISVKLITNCCHEFEYDYIDITPDISERICYCIHCETNFENCKHK